MNAENDSPGLLTPSSESNSISNQTKNAKASSNFLPKLAKLDRNDVTAQVLGTHLSQQNKTDLKDKADFGAKSPA